MAVARTSSDASAFRSRSHERIVVPPENGLSARLDRHPARGAGVYFLRIAGGSAEVGDYLLGTHVVRETAEDPSFGRLLRVDAGEQRLVLWLPIEPCRYAFDPRGRIAAAGAPTVAARWETDPRLSVHVEGAAGEGPPVLLPCVVLEDDGAFDEIRRPFPVESRRYLKSSWFEARRPADLFRYLIDGSLYDPRSDPRVGKRFKCQQCAYAWWSLLDFLANETGKAVHAVLRDEVAWSVLQDLSPAGEWGHGYWSDSLETHARFHLDGIRLLVERHRQDEEEVWLVAAELAAEFARDRLSERLADGALWFLHDTIEDRTVPRIRSTVLGKSPGNSLCLNTHVQALAVLCRLSARPGVAASHGAALEAGMLALRRVLERRPGERAHRGISRWLLRPATERPSGALAVRAARSLRNRLARRVGWWIHRRWPRHVHPNGFIERDLTLSLGSDRYHVIHLKDLLELYGLRREDWLPPYIRRGVDFVRALDLDAALDRSPYYIEWVDVLRLYEALIEPLPEGYVAQVEDRIHRRTGGCSLDFRVGRPRLGT